MYPICHKTLSGNKSAPGNNERNKNLKYSLKLFTNINSIYYGY
jgi:hypothetical protein